ncbi:hypothetical protein IX84_10025 [Phaeodactylibacter xiamenensis]|uniref:Uncharacterized protein n=1 Tax=Phaeodactylibacter xiamenensis TaxID=1524460 RepID=A0A098SAP5_9BACT|nr:hypothetical protein IX84_10025 [Phaeodactylibacter xiamenensis]
MNTAGGELHSSFLRNKQKIRGDEFSITIYELMLSLAKKIAPAGKTGANWEHFGNVVKRIR